MLFLGDKKEYLNLLLQISNDMDVMVFVSAESAVTAYALNALEHISCQKVLYLHGMHEFAWKKKDFNSLKDFILKILRNIRWHIYYEKQRKKIGKFDKIIHLHEKDASYNFFEKRYPKKNFILENFAEDVFFLESKSKKKDSDYYIYIANYQYGKNQILLLKAFYLMKKDFKLIFIGSEKTEYYYRLLKLKIKLDKKYGINKKVVFLNNISRVELSKYLNESYAYIMTSRSEHFPISIIEAMSTGIPVISTDVGIVRYLPGCILVKDNPEFIAQAMDELIENKETYLKNKYEARIYAQKHFIFDNYLAKFEEIIQ